MRKLFKCDTMNSSLLFLWMLVLSGASAASAIDHSESCKTTEELNDVCGTHTFQSIKPILNYVDQLQREQLTCEEERREVSKLRAKVQELEVKVAEGKLNEKLIAASETAALSKDTHIKDLQATISDLRNTNSLITTEIAKLKTFIQGEFNEKLSKINSSASKLLYCEDQLEKNKKTVAEYDAQLKSKDDGLQSCELRLNETQNGVRDCKNQLENQNKTIARNTATISQLQADIERKDKTLKNTQAELKDEIQKQNEITEQMKVEVTKLKEQIKEKEEIPTSCTSFGDSNGVHNICFETFPVLCNSEIAGPGWTVIQQRINGRENFYRNWEDYKNGFGQMSGDFFLGLEKIHRLTNEKPHELYIYMEPFKVNYFYKSLSFYARYDNFRIAGEADKYRLLSLGTYSGNAGEDRMRYHEHAKFSTFDSDNDKNIFGKCAIDHHAGWWYNGCTDCNLNGKYYQEEVYNVESNWWHSGYSLKTIKMLIRPRGN